MEERARAAQHNWELGEFWSLKEASSLDILIVNRKRGSSALHFLQGELMGVSKELFLAFYFVFRSRGRVVIVGLWFPRMGRNQA